jgi:hypothetical protein
VAALAVCLAGSFGAAPAEAGPARYVYEICDSALPSGGVEGVVYAPHPRGFFSSENTCGQPGGALVVGQNEIPPGNGEGGDSDWAVPVIAAPGTSLESITITGSACGASDELAITSSQWIEPVTVWPPATCQQDVRSFRLLDPAKAFFYIRLKCVNKFATDNHCHAGPRVLGHYFATTVLDRAAPTLAAIEGSMLADGVRRGRQTITVHAADSGGGLSGAEVLVNGVAAGEERRFACATGSASNPSVFGTVAAEPAPCPSTAEASWTIDTGAYPFRDGPNSVRVCASDFATVSDPNTTCSAPHTVEVDNSCAESAVPGGEVLGAEFDRSHTEEVTVGYGHGALVTGKLANNAGDPIRGARLCVRAATIGVGQRPADVATVTTDAEGRYGYEVPPGPNREVTVGYRHDSSQVARDVRYYAQAGPTLRVSSPRARNGGRLRYWGELPGPSNVGRVVVLQAGTVGSRRWITFRKAITKANGVFRASYHFIHTTSRTRYRFRAVVPRQAGYPWVAGQSKPVRVLVVPR